jgi:hypothetical protein
MLCDPSMTMVCKIFDSQVVYCVCIHHGTSLHCNTLATFQIHVLAVYELNISKPLRASQQTSQWVVNRYWTYTLWLELVVFTVRTTASKREPVRSVYLYYCRWRLLTLHGNCNWQSGLITISTSKHVTGNMIKLKGDQTASKGHIS